MNNPSLRQIQVILLASLFLINEGTIHWVQAIYVGNHSVAEGFDDAFKYFTLTSFIFMSVLRAIPLVILYFIVRKILTFDIKSAWTVFIGGLIGIWWCYISLVWSSFVGFYTDEHVSSTGALIFLFIPIYSSITGAIGAGVVLIPYKAINETLENIKAK